MLHGNIVKNNCSQTNLKKNTILTSRNIFAVLYYFYFGSQAIKYNIEVDLILLKILFLILLSRIRIRISDIVFVDGIATISKIWAFYFLQINNKITNNYTYIYKI